MSEHLEIRSEIRTQGEIFSYIVTTHIFDGVPDLVTNIEIVDTGDKDNYRHIIIQTTDIDTFRDVLVAHIEALEKSLGGDDYAPVEEV